MDSRRSNPEATISVIRQIVGPLRKKEIGLAQAYAMMNVALGLSREECRPLLEPSREEAKPAISTGERALLFIEWQLKDTRARNAGWREALEEVGRVMSGHHINPDLLQGEGLPPPPELVGDSHP